eukprot:6204211-Pleurochrysis_carterae.AAC.8
MGLLKPLPFRGCVKVTWGRVGLAMSGETTWGREVVSGMVRTICPLHLPAAASICHRYGAHCSHERPLLKAGLPILKTMFK